MKNIPLLILLCIVGLCATDSLQAQSEPIQGEVSTVDSSVIRIVNTYPDSFPNVSVVFKAETKAGEPLWDLQPSDMVITENAQVCKVVSLEQISDAKRIHLSMIIDHSGSMGFDPLNFFFGKKEKEEPTPIYYAKDAALQFVSSFPIEKDFISVVGFSDSISERISLTQDTELINRSIQDMEAKGLTAFYDAILAGMAEIEHSNGVKVIVALTDGQDNSSAISWEEFLSTIQAKEIPIYIIGLGNINYDRLSQISQASKGRFFYTNSPESLDSIYQEISKQIQAFYDLTYASANLASNDTVRSLQIAFDIDSKYQASDSAVMELPEEVVAYLKEKEQEKRYYLMGGIVMGSVALAGLLVYTFGFAGAASMQIASIYPNPSKGLITLKGKNLGGSVSVLNANGQLVKTLELPVDGGPIDLSGLPDGNYLLQVKDGEKASKAVKLILQK